MTREAKESGRVYEQAKKANNYARSFIKKGFTQLEVNTYSDDCYKALSSAVDAQREATRVEGLLESLTSLTNNFVLDLYEREIENSKKTSLGNCQELAFLALDYFVENAPDINVELVNIKNGDHVFLVVGRTHGVLKNKSTWNAGAYICDPWSGENGVVCHADTAIIHNYFRKKLYDIPTAEEKQPRGTLQPVTDMKMARYENCIEPMRHHQFIADYILNTTDLINSRKKENIQKIFNKKLKLIVDAAYKLQKKLKFIAANIRRKYGIADTKYKVIISKADKLADLLATLKNSGVDLRSESSHEEITMRLRAHLHYALSKCYATISCNAAEVKDLTKHRDENAMQRFFKIPSKTEALTNEAFNDFNTQMKLLSKHLR